MRLKDAATLSLFGPVNIKRPACGRPPYVRPPSVALQPPIDPGWSRDQGASLLPPDSPEDPRGSRVRAPLDNMSRCVGEGSSGFGLMPWTSLLGTRSFVYPRILSISPFFHLDIGYYFCKGNCWEDLQPPRKWGKWGWGTWVSCGVFLAVVLPLSPFFAIFLPLVEVVRTISIVIF